MVQFEVESAGIADWLAVAVASPQRRRRRQAVGTPQARPTATRRLQYIHSTLPAAPVHRIQYSSIIDTTPHVNDRNLHPGFV